LFGKSTRKGKKGNANAYEDQKHSSLPRDGVFRVWYKSDPATTAVFDRRSVEYIVRSGEGKKYFHFFKSMLLGSEEHYFITLLANWKTTRPYVNQFASMAVWNTWSLGSLHPQLKHNRSTAGIKSPHTSFLSLAELPVLRGLSRSGVFFARKFSGKYSALLDQIDESILYNQSFPSGEALISGPKKNKKKVENNFLLNRKKKSKFSAQDRRQKLRSHMMGSLAP
jgi:hypothetical protein